MHKTKTLPLVLFSSNDGKTRIQAHLQDENLCLTQKQIAELFEKSNKTVSEHLTNIYDDGELEPDSTIRELIKTGIVKKIKTGKYLYKNSNK